MNRINLIGELVLSLLIAGLCSSVVVVVLIFIFGNLSMLDTFGPSINAIGGVAFGVMFGYRLNDMIRRHKTKF